MSDSEIDNKEIEKQKDYQNCNLELGDVITIQAKDNKDYHDQNFFILYIDDKEIHLTNIESYQNITIYIDDDGNIKDESIESITILNRSDEKGYARQYSLLPKTWIDIQFGGETPVIITGEITNLEEDMIEITTYPDLDVIYIDFGYKGIPLYLQIESITIRPKPTSLDKIESLLNVKETIPDGEGFDPGFIPDNQEAVVEYQPSGEYDVKVSEDVEKDQTINEKLQTLYNAARENVYGEDLDDLERETEIPEHQRRHGIETQVNDMLDVLLSEIPDIQRTPKVIDNIHHLIQRFKELRKEFSLFDEHNNIYDRKSNGLGHKPLKESLLQFNKKLKWILPVVCLKKKLYTDDKKDTSEFNDIVKLNISDDIIKEATLLEDYYKNRIQNGDESLYVKYHQMCNEYGIPFEEPADKNLFLSPDTKIHDAIECVIDNLENFHTTIMSKSSDKIDYDRRQYVIQKFNLHSSYLEPIISKTGKKIFIRSNITNNENATVKSIMFLPKPVIHFSSIDLPGTSILKKSMLGQNYMYLFKVLSKKRTIDKNMITNFDEKMDQKFWEIPFKDGSFNSNIQNYLLDDTIDQHSDRFKKYLYSIIPDSENIIRLFDLLYENNDHLSMMNVRNAVNKLEPFLVYIKDINYSQFNAIRYFIKEKRNAYINSLDDARKEYSKLISVNHHYDVPVPNRVSNLFNEKKDILSVVIDLYKLIEYKSSDKTTYRTSYEWLKTIYNSDDGSLFNNLLRLLMISLITPESISAALKDKLDENEDMGKYEKIKAGDCSRRVLTKKYDSMKSLQKDNGKDIFYDKEMDDTPYDIMKDYSEEIKKYSPDDLIEFLEEALIQKHDCPPKMAPEMARNLVQGNKLIRDGEYAMLEELPHLKEEKGELEFSKKEKESIVNEANILKKMSYFKRVNNQWVHDESVDDSVFIDGNTLFCNMSKICFRDQKKKRCESLDDAEKRMKIDQRKKLIDEFDERFTESFENLEEELQNLVEKSRKENQNKTRLNEVKQLRYNTYSFDLGKLVKKIDTLKSPHLQHMEEILGQDDFVKKQNDIIKFAEYYCRDPMVDELGDNMYYLYCVDTNKPLLPTSLYKLAKAFVSKNNYMSVLSEICRKQGRIEGDKIVDDYTGRLLRKIDFAEEDGFDEQGFRQVTNELIEKDAFDTTIAAQEKKTKMKDRVFDNAETQLIFKLYRTIVGHIGITTDDIEEFVLRETINFVNDTSVVKSERAYKLEAKELLDKKKRLPPYEIYRNKLIILIVTSVILVAIQTAIPSFKIQKTFPGCVQSFRGFPENNGAIEDTSGVDYLACILNTLKTKSSKPWNSIKPLPLEVLKQQLIQLITRIVLPKQTFIDLYLKKIEYLREHPELDLPKEHSIEKWVHFMPPVITYAVEKKIKGLPSEYKSELNEMLKTANMSQQKQLDMFKTKSVLFSYALVENINSIIKQKGLLLKTGSGVYFTENACCNDRNTKTFMDYFFDENKELMVYVRMIYGWGEIIENVKQRTIAPFLFDPKQSGLTYSSDIQNEHFEKNVYLAFIRYCNLDSDLPIPQDLQSLFSEKMHDYPRDRSLMEKIDFLKQNGKRFTKNNLLQLMEIVNKRNIVDTKKQAFKGNRISALEDLLDHVNTKYGDDEDIVLSNRLRQLLKGVLNKYNPKTLVAEDSDETYNLNNWLSHANTNLLERIVDFLSKNSNLTKRKMEQLEEQLANIHLWNMDSTYEYGNGVSPKEETNMYSVTQFMRESVYLMSKVYPEMINNKHIMSSKSHKHWGFGQLHNLDVSKFIEGYYKQLTQFKNDDSLSLLLKHVQDELVYVYQFLDLIPTFLPIHRAPEGESPAQSYYSLFTKRTLYMLYSYIWYSVIYEYIKATDDEELLLLNTVERNQMRRSNIRELREQVIGESSEEIKDDTLAEYEGDMVEIQIQTGDKAALNKSIGELLLIFINMDITNKKKFDLSYRDIEKKITRSKLNEKKMITDFLKNMDDDERRVEDMQKSLKLGRWNVGLQKGLVEYSKDRYNEERKQLFDQLASKTDIDMDDIVIQKDISEIESEEAQDVEDFYDEEANDLRGYNGVDGDGMYYEEDKDDDFMEN